MHEECPKNTGAGEKKTVKKPSQTSRGVLVGPKMGFKPQKDYLPVPKKPNASFSGSKKKGAKPTIDQKREDTTMKRISDKRTKNQAKTDKTRHGMEKRGKDKAH
ncbi:hypothetical protein Tco_0585864 [Tanacetum coccineum]